MTKDITKSLENEMSYIKTLDCKEEHLIFSFFEEVKDRVKDVDSMPSGGGFNHIFLHLEDNHIIAIHPENMDVEHSYEKWDSIDDYTITSNDEERGFGWEHNSPNYDSRIINLWSIHDAIEQKFKDENL